MKDRGSANKGEQRDIQRTNIAEIQCQNAHKPHMSNLEGRSFSSEATPLVFSLSDDKLEENLMLVLAARFSEPLRG
jgi:hypothetical protein